MKHYTIRFDDARTAKLAAGALRRRGFNVTRKGIDVTVLASNAKNMFQAISSWSLQRRSIPNWHLIEF